MFRLSCGLLLLTLFTSAAPFAAAAPPAAATRPSSPTDTVDTIASRLTDLIARDRTALNPDRQTWAVEMLLREGRIDAARKLFGVAKLNSDDLKRAGQLMTMLPGGVTGADARALMAKHRIELNRVGTLEGVAIGYAYAGDIKRALAEVPKLKEPAWERTLLAELMVVRPAQPFINAFMKTPRLSISAGHGAPLLRAYIILGQNETAENFVREMRASVKNKPAGGESPDLRIDIFGDDPEPIIFRATFYGHLAKGDVEKAVAIERERFEQAMARARQAKDPKFEEFGAREARLDAYHAIVAARALRGDMPGAQAAADEVKEIYGAHVLAAPLAYAVARWGDVAQLDAFLGGLPQALTSSPNAYAATLGAASAGRAAAGDPAGAARYADAVLSKLDAGDERAAAQHAHTLLYLMAGTALGPEALLFLDEHFESYPLRLLPEVRPRPAAAPRKTSTRPTAPVRPGPPKR